MRFRNAFHLKIRALSGLQVEKDMSAIYTSLYFHASRCRRRHRRHACILLGPQRHNPARMAGATACLDCDVGTYSLLGTAPHAPAHLVLFRSSAARAVLLRTSLFTELQCVCTCTLCCSFSRLRAAVEDGLHPLPARDVGGC